MSIFDMIIGKIAPHDCLGCNAEGYLLCAACTDKLTAVPERCYRCERASTGYLTCETCRDTSWLRGVGVAAVYETAAKALVWKLKLAGAQSAAAIMAKRMALLVKDITKETTIIPVPTATGRVRQRGYDQARLLARELSRQTRLPYRDYLARSGQTHQHGLSRQERLSQLEAAFRIKRPNSVRDTHVILVDDVVTTGATLEAAAAKLRLAGAARIDAVVFARPEIKSV